MVWKLILGLWDYDSSKAAALNSADQFTLSKFNFLCVITHVAVLKQNYYVTV